MAFGIAANALAMHVLHYRQQPIVGYAGGAGRLVPEGRGPAVAALVTLLHLSKQDCQALAIDAPHHLSHQMDAFRLWTCPRLQQME